MHLVQQLLDKPNTSCPRTAGKREFIGWVEEQFSSGYRFLTFADGVFHLLAEEPVGCPAACLESPRDAMRLYSHLPALTKRSGGFLVEHRNDPVRALSALSGWEEGCCRTAMEGLSFDAWCGVASAIDKRDGDRAKSLLKASGFAV